MCSGAVAVVGCEDDDAVVPEIETVYFIHDYANLCVHVLNQAEIGVAVTAPVVRGIVHAWVERIVLSLFETQDRRIVWCFLKICWKVRTIRDFCDRSRGVRGFLSAGVFTDVVWVDE